MRYLLFTFLIVFLFGSCAEKDALSQYRPEIEAPHEVEIIPEDETLVLSDLVDGYELIEPKGIILSSLLQIEAYDSLWIVQATSIDKDVLHLLDAESIVQTDQFESMGNYGMGVYKPMYERVVTVWDDLYEAYCAAPFPVEKVNFYHRDPEARERTTLT